MPSSPAKRKPDPLEPTPTHYIDDSKIETLCTALELGNSYTNACAIAMIRYDVFKRWMELGGYPLIPPKTKDVITPETAEEPYASFVMRVHASVALAESRAVNQLVSAGDRDWRAAAYWLERRRGAEWSAPEKESRNTPHVTQVQVYLPDNGRSDSTEIIEATGAVIREIEG